MPALPWQLFERLTTEFELPAYDAELLTTEKPTADFFLELTQHTPNYKAASNLIINKIAPYCSREAIEILDFPVDHPTLAAFIQLIDDGKVSNTIAYERILPELIDDPAVSPLEWAQRLNLIQTSDEDVLEKLADQVLEQFPDKVAAYRNGKKGLIGFFMGQIMRASKGKADPKVTNELLTRKLNG